MQDKRWLTFPNESACHPGHGVSGNLNAAQNVPDEVLENPRRGIHGESKRLWTRSKTGESQPSRLKQESPALRRGECQLP